MVVVINKVDLLAGSHFCFCSSNPKEKDREKQVEKMKFRISKTLEATRFANSPMVEVSANPNIGNTQTGICQMFC
jgi:hypothetical protein